METQQLLKSVFPSSVPDSRSGEVVANIYERYWNRSRDEAWKSDKSDTWSMASVWADRAAMASDDPDEIAKWISRCDFASQRARQSRLAGL